MCPIASRQTTHLCPNCLFTRYHRVTQLRVKSLLHITALSKSSIRAVSFFRPQKRWLQEVGCEGSLCTCFVRTSTKDSLWTRLGKCHHIFIQTFPPQGVHCRLGRLWAREVSSSPAVLALFKDTRASGSTKDWSSWTQAEGSPFLGPFTSSASRRYRTISSC